MATKKVNVNPKVTTYRIILVIRTKVWLLLKIYAKINNIDVKAHSKLLSSVYNNKLKELEPFDNKIKPQISSNNKIKLLTKDNLYLFI